MQAKPWLLEYQSHTYFEDPPPYPPIFQAEGNTARQCQSHEAKSSGLSQERFKKPPVARPASGGAPLHHTVTGRELLRLGRTQNHDSAR